MDFYGDRLNTTHEPIRSCRSKKTVELVKSWLHLQNVIKDDFSTSSSVKGLSINKFLGAQVDS